MRMAAAVAAAGIALASAAITVPPAMAGCARTIAWSVDQGVVGQVDNCPGARADSWSWIYDGGWNGQVAIIELEFVHGDHGYLPSGDGRSSANTWADDIRRARLCKQYSLSLPSRLCGGRHYM